MENNKANDWPYANTVYSVKLMGAKHVQKDVNEVLVDKEKRIITTPAFMKNNPDYFQVYEGIGKMVDELFKLC
jgi:enhancing lycopene biosynthesis protein 2